MAKVFKFNGALLKDADGVKDLIRVLAQYKSGQVLIVVSAMGNITRRLEELTNSYVNGNDDVNALFDEIKQFHEKISADLFGDTSDPVFDEIANTLIEIEWMLEDEPHPDYNFNYDQIVSIGELLSSRIIAAYLNNRGLNAKWIDARGYIHTDNNYRAAAVNIEKSGSSIKGLDPIPENQFIITQASIGGTSENFTTTLGSGDNDYSAAIFASCIKAESLTIFNGSDSSDSGITSDRAIQLLQDAGVEIIK